MLTFWNGEVIPTEDELITLPRPLSRLIAQK